VRQAKPTGASGPALIRSRGTDRHISAAIFDDSCFLVLFSPLLFTEAFTRESFFGATPFSGLHEVAVFLDFLDDVFRLNFPLEAPESVLQRFALLNYDFSHA
jgi:hypothetical protein